MSHTDESQNYLTKNIQNSEFGITFATEFSFKCYRNVSAKLYSFYDYMTITKLLHSFFPGGFKITIYRKYAQIVLHPDQC